MLNLPNNYNWISIGQFTHSFKQETIIFRKVFASIILLSSVMIWFLLPPLEVE